MWFNREIIINWPAYRTNLNHLNFHFWYVSQKWKRAVKYRSQHQSKFKLRWVNSHRPSWLLEWPWLVASLEVQPICRDISGALNSTVKRLCAAPIVSILLDSYLFLAATSSSRNTPWLLLLFFFLWIMMMLPLIINSYNLVNFHQNLVKLILNWRITLCLSFLGIIFLFFFPFFLEKSDFSAFVDLEKFQTWYIRSELWSPKTSSFMHGLTSNWL